MREHTKASRDLASALTKLTDQYFEKLKRAETEYFAGVKRVTDDLMNDVATAIIPASQEEPQVITQ
jgi:hypothetical protein